MRLLRCIISCRYLRLFLDGGKIHQFPTEWASTSRSSQRKCQRDDEDANENLAKAFPLDVVKAAKGYFECPVCVADSRYSLFSHQRAAGLV
jgi:phosphoketolase